MLVSDFDYHLPEALIAQEPLPDRAASRMLHLSRSTGSWQDRNFRDLPDLLRPDDLLMVNDTRVFAARLYGRRSGQRAQPLSPRNPAAKRFLRGRVEVLLTKDLGNCEWEALVHPGRKIGIGERRLRFRPVPDFLEQVERLGHVPLPPYIGRADRPDDRERYQTVYARARGSVAAPTAGLHFTPEILGRIRERGVEVGEITLHVGLGTFQPVRTERVEDHKMHSERFSIPQEAAAKINAAVEKGRRVVAVGTTTVRTLEFAARTTGRVQAGSGEADLFIYPGFRFKVVGALLTNFHLPKSTLLMLVSAFAGRELVLKAYEHAVRERYRLYSYGDCMFIE